MKEFWRKCNEVSEWICVGSYCIGLFIVMLVVFGGYLTPPNVIVLESPNSETFLLVTLSVLLLIWVSASLSKFILNWATVEGRQSAANAVAKHLFKLSCIAAAALVLSEQSTISISHIAAHDSSRQQVRIEAVERSKVTHPRRTGYVETINLLLAINLPDGRLAKFSLKSSESNVKAIDIRRSPQATVCVALGTGRWGGYWVNPRSLELNCKIEEAAA